MDYRHLQYTEEEVERSYEEFYEDVHTEFQKFGEIINFKVKCEFVSLTRWKVALCGEYMKSRLKTCSRGSACNFLHCFMNPGGDYKWADSDKPPPRFWVEKMVALFGHSDDDTRHNKQIEQPSPNDHNRLFTSDRDIYHEKRHRSIEKSQHNGSSSRSHHDENHIRKSKHCEQKNDNKNYEHVTKYKNNDTDSEGDRLNKNTPRRHREGSQNHSRRKTSESKNRDNYRKSKRRSHGSSSDEDFYTKKRRFDTKSRSRSPKNKELDDVKYEPSETELERRKERKKDHRRSRRRDRDGGSGEVERRRRRGGSRSGDGECFSEKIEMSDRWEPVVPPDELKDSERDSKRSYEENRRSHERDDKIREKMKRI